MPSLLPKSLALCALVITYASPLLIFHPLGYFVTEGLFSGVVLDESAAPIVPNIHLITKSTQLKIPRSFQRVSVDLSAEKKATSHFPGQIEPGEVVCASFWLIIVSFLWKDVGTADFLFFRVEKIIKWFLPPQIHRIWCTFSILSSANWSPVPPCVLWVTSWLLVVRRWRQSLEQAWSIDGPRLCHSIPVYYSRNRFSPVPFNFLFSLLVF